MHKYLSRTISRLSSSEPVVIVRVSGCLPGLHPIHLYWFRTRMTDVPLDGTARLNVRLRQTRPANGHYRFCFRPGCLWLENSIASRRSWRHAGYCLDCEELWTTFSTFAGPLVI